MDFVTLEYRESFIRRHTGPVDRNRNTLEPSHLLSLFLKLLPITETVTIIIHSRVVPTLKLDIRILEFLRAIAKATIRTTIITKRRLSIRKIHIHTRIIHPTSPIFCNFVEVLGMLKETGLVTINRVDAYNAFKYLSKKLVKVPCVIDKRNSFVRAFRAVVDSFTE